VLFRSNDLVRAAVAKLRDDINAELTMARAAELAARRGFENRMRAEVVVDQAATIEAACRLCGTTPARLSCNVLLEMTDDVIAAPPIFVPVVLRDGELYEARLVMRVQAQVHEDTFTEWLEAVKRRQAAERRSTKVKDLGDDARAAVVVSVLEGTDEGRRILELLATVCTKVANDHDQETPAE
jgi:hypothetical protein